MDNTLTFAISGVNEAGEVYGALTHDAGEDGNFANFIWNETSVSDGTTTYTPPADDLNVNDHYRKIPTGVSTWTRKADGSVVITQTVGETTTTSTFSVAEEGVQIVEAYDGDSDSNNDAKWTPTHTALKFGDLIKRDSPLTEAESGMLTWKAYAQIVYSPFSFYIQIEKQ